MEPRLGWTPARAGADGTLSAPLADAFTAMLAAARNSAEAASEAPARALHDYRRALRRAQALLLIARPTLRRFPRSWLEASLAHALRKTSAPRDAAALAGRVAELGALIPEFAATEPAALDALAALVNAQRDELGSAENVAWRMRKNVRALAGLGDVFAAALRKDDGDALGDGLRRVYRRARCAWRRAEASKHEAHIHAWRRATRDLRHALELLAARAEAEPGPLPASAFATAHHGAQAIVQTLGLATDLMVLSALVRTTEAAALEGAREAALRALVGATEAQVAAAHALAEAFFAARPRAFLAPVASACAEEPAGAPAPEPAPEPAPVRTEA